MEYVQMTLNDWLDIKQRLKLELQGVKQSFVRIGYVLRKIDDQKLYEQDGYKSIAEFAKAEYGLEASTVSRFMSINREYSIDGYSEHLKEEYMDMGRSQLEEMLKLPEKDREMIRPETPRADIRELKGFNKTEPAAGVADDVHQLIEMFYKENPDVLNGVFTTDSLEQRKEVVNPSGNRSFKKGMFFLMMYEDNIKIKKFGADPITMTWTEFFGITMAIFADAVDGPNTWKNYFGGDGEAENVPEQTVEVAKEETDNASDDTSEKSAIAPAQKSLETPVNTSSESISEEVEDGPKNSKNETEKAENGTEKPQKVPHAPVEGYPDTDFEEKTALEPPLKTSENVINTSCESILNEQESVEEQGQQDTVETELCMTRKTYMDSLTGFGMACYLVEQYKKNILTTDHLESITLMGKWMKGMVDEKGRCIEELEQNGSYE